MPSDLVECEACGALYYADDPEHKHLNFHRHIGFLIGSIDVLREALVRVSGDPDAGK